MTAMAMSAMETGPKWGRVYRPPIHGAEHTNLKEKPAPVCSAG